MTSISVGGKEEHEVSQSQLLCLKEQLQEQHAYLDSVDVSVYVLGALYAEVVHYFDEVAEDYLKTVFLGARQNCRHPLREIAESSTPGI